MTLSAMLGLREGERVAVVGCGGKTSLIARLAEENAARGVLIAPTTRIFLNEAPKLPGIMALGRRSGDKLLAAPLGEVEAASRKAGLTLMEADGSKGLPLKGWAAHEPVVPGFTTLTLAVASVRAVGLPATGAHVHRLLHFLAITGLREGEAVTEKAVARMLRWCLARHAVGRQAVILNQADGPREAQTAMRVAEALAGFDGPILMGSLREGKWTIA